MLVRFTTKNINICFYYLFYPSGDKHVVFFSVFLDRLRFCKEQLCRMYVPKYGFNAFVSYLILVGFFFVPKISFFVFFLLIFRHIKKLLGRAPSLAKL